MPRLNKTRRAVEQYDAARDKFTSCVRNHKEYNDEMYRLYREMREWDDNVDEAYAMDTRDNSMRGLLHAGNIGDDSFIRKALREDVD